MVLYFKGLKAKLESKARKKQLKNYPKSKNPKYVSKMIIMTTN